MGAAVVLVALPTVPHVGCYCDLLPSGFRREHGIPEGHCGTCERCGRPGHLQHHPGPVPCTGAWCDHCLKIVAVRTWIIVLLGPMLAMGVIVGVITLVVSVCR
jgi:hypothetical protein